MPLTVLGRGFVFVLVVERPREAERNLALTRIRSVTLSDVTGPKIKQNQDVFRERWTNKRTGTCTCPLL